MLREWQGEVYSFYPSRTSPKHNIEIIYVDLGSIVVRFGGGLWGLVPFDGARLSPPGVTFHNNSRREKR